jgi:16S rRNA (guanine527-N7)-methyltransferase
LSSATHRAQAAIAALEPLLAAAPAIAASLPAGWAERAESFVALLLEANERRNLTRVTEPAAVARDHLLDALAALPAIDARRPDRVVDLGSGGGVPALPLALARPELEWTLIESVQGKAAFLSDAARALGLDGVTVVAERAEALGRTPRHRERHDLAIARACAALPVLVELALPLVRVGGALLAWKGPLNAGDEEAGHGAAAAALLGGSGLTIEGTGLPALGGRTFVFVDKRQPTPPRYPRRPGEPGRRPLG